MQFKLLENLRNVKEISAFSDSFAALDTLNQIIIWKCEKVDEIQKFK